MPNVESGEPDSTNQVLNHLRYLQRVMDVSLVPESKHEVFVAGMHSLSFRGFLDREVMGQTMWAFAESPDIDRADKLNVDRHLRFSGRIASVGYLQDQEANVDSIVVGIKQPTIEAEFSDHVAAAYESDDFYRIGRLQLPVLAIQQWEIARWPTDDIFVA